MTSGVYTREMTSARLAILTPPLSLDALSALVEAEARQMAEGCGAMCSFVGTVRATHQGRAVRYLEYEAFTPLAEKALHYIANEVATEWPRVALGIHHRVGRLDVGDASVLVVAASAHRAEAFIVCRYAIERVKQIVPVWKHEFFDDGDAWVEGAAADPYDEPARQQAMARACS